MGDHLISIMRKSKQVIHSSFCFVAFEQVAWTACASVVLSDQLQETTLNVFSSSTLQQ